MSDKILNSPDYIVSNEILFYKGEFTIEDILNKVKEKLLNKFDNSVEQIKLFIKNKISSLCEIGLISDTGIFYYVN